MLHSCAEMHFPIGNILLPESIEVSIRRSRGGPLGAQEYRDEFHRKPMPLREVLAHHHRRIYQGGQTGHGPPGGWKVPQLIEGSKSYQPGRSTSHVAPVQLVMVPLNDLGPPVQIFCIRLCTTIDHMIHTNEVDIDCFLVHSLVL